MGRWRMNGWMHEWIGRQVDEGMDGRMDVASLLCCWWQCCRLGTCCCSVKSVSQSTNSGVVAVAGNVDGDVLPPWRMPEKMATITSDQCKCRTIRRVESGRLRTNRSNRAKRNS